MNPVRLGGLRRNLSIGCWPLLGSLLALGAGCGSGDSNQPGTTGDQTTVGTPNGMFGGSGGSASAAAGNGAVNTGSGTGGNAVQAMGSGGSGVTVAAGAIHSIGNTPLPCDVGKAVAKNCNMCHGATPIGGAPMPLLTQGDFQADHVVQFYKPL